VVFHITLPRQGDPDAFDCGSGGTYGPKECWIKLLITPAQDNNDTTTWNAKILGAPARLTG
jgi:hypothetical protein